MKIFILLCACLVVATAQLSADEEWATFKKTFKKSYKLQEEELRFQVFQKNLRKIVEHNSKYEKGEKSYFLKITKFADWTDKELNAILNPKIVAKAQHKNTKTFVRDPNLTRPASIDWRDKAVLAVKDQANCGSCWAFSTTGALEGQLAIHKNQAIPLSEQELMDCDTGNSACFGGNPDVAFEYIESNGISSESQYEYTQQKGECRKVENKPVSSISGWLGVPSDEDALMEAVAQYGPVSVSVFANNDWSLYGGGIFEHASCRGHPNHAVLAVGYTQKSWIVKNSWGAAWGEDGYIQLSLGNNQCNITFASQIPLL
ncbi:cathepsin L-like proteinase [Diabrotica undecimpunctata]|uniref:cathepsin L-like proteinase n=1 Tax=Diabrotica undecimpunctata TaxID=50387 RepID=UPI003B631CA5